MKNQEIQQTQKTSVSKKIAETLELLEMSGKYEQKHIDIIRKAMWSVYDYSILIKKTVSSNDNSTRNQ
jgi:hypothetical protein